MGHCLQRTLAQHHVRDRAAVPKRVHSANLRCLRVGCFPDHNKLARHRAWLASRRTTHVWVEYAQLRIRRRLAIYEAQCKSKYPARAGGRFTMREAGLDTADHKRVF